MTWTNGPLVVFHGTDEASAAAISKFGIDPRVFRTKTDFGPGFYVTTNAYQAEQWASKRCRLRPLRAAVIAFELRRDEIERLTHLCFTRDDADYRDFVAYCRKGQPNHGPGRTRAYALVYGPVSLWPQWLTIADCDQILFTDPKSITGFSSPTSVRVPSGGKALF